MNVNTLEQNCAQLISAWHLTCMLSIFKQKMTVEPIRLNEQLFVVTNI